MRTLSDSADQKAICATLSGGILVASMTAGGSLGGYGLGPSRVSRLCGGEPSVLGPGVLITEFLAQGY